MTGMAEYRLLISDITEFGSLRCVAGWDLDREKMIRPEPSPGDFWPESVTGPGAPFGRGAIVEFEARTPSPVTEYPHRTEDRVVIGRVKRTQTLSASERLAILSGTTSEDLDSLFDSNLQVENMRGYIPRGTQCRSLGAIEVDASAVSIFEDTDWGKKRLRCRMRHGNRTIHPTVTSTLARETYRAGGIEAVSERLANARRLHLRIGLARSFAQQPDRCYVQINDIYVVR